MTGAEVFLKAENLQKTGSFKVRGAFNKIMEVRGDKVIAASMGNHAQGVAFAAARLGKKAKIVMPVTAAIVKQEATRGYGAEVILYGDSFSEALDYALSHKDHEFIHAFDDDAVIAGQGTVGLEIAEDVRDVRLCLGAGRRRRPCLGDRGGAQITVSGIENYRCSDSGRSFGILLLQRQYDI